MTEVAKAAAREPYDGSVMTVEDIGGGRLMMTDREMVSARDGERYEKVPGVGRPRTLQNHHMMSLLVRRGVPVAYLNTVGETSIMCDDCEMIPLEVIVRAVIPEGSSHLARHPQEMPRYLDGRVVEFFHKQTVDTRGGKPVLRDGNALRREVGLPEFVRLKKAGVFFPDPYLDTRPREWWVHAADRPLDGSAPLLMIQPLVADDVEVEIHTLARRAFDTLFLAFAELPEPVMTALGLEALVLADIKFEFGWRKRDRALVLADVVNLDSLRLLKNGRLDKGGHLSKQLFRDGEPVEKLLAAYETGLNAVQAFDEM